MMYAVGPDGQTLEKSPQRGQFGDLALLSNATATLGYLELVLNVNSYFHLWALVLNENSYFDLWAPCRALSVKSYDDL